VPKQEWTTHSREETIQRGRDIGAALKAPVLILLSGELGAGKTTFTKGLVHGIGAAEEDEVTSPTFTLVHKYERGTLVHKFERGMAAQEGGEKSDEGARVYHVDLYRVGNFHDLETLGLEDVFSEKTVVIVEWPDRFTLRTDWPVVRVHLEHVAEEIRRITVED
jgi:tRNA threonylcarbamoyladenosine biosynthesis protein TsaE